jgi:hypothetical protein
VFNPARILWDRWMPEEEEPQVADTETVALEDGGAP